MHIKLMLRTAPPPLSIVALMEAASLNLHSTEIRVGDSDLVGQMTRMREWLDSRRFEPAVFRYDHVDSSVVIRVDFAAADEAAAFAREFRGTLLR
jgi:hypothetical protein